MTSRGLRTGIRGKSVYRDRLRSDKLRLQLGLSFLGKHGQDFLEIAAQLVQGFGLTVGARETWHVPDVQTRIGTNLDDCCIRLHLKSLHGERISFLGPIIPREVGAIRKHGGG